jgi:hypothetical protein
LPPEYYRATLAEDATVLRLTPTLGPICRADRPAGAVELAQHSGVVDHEQADIRAATQQQPAVDIEAPVADFRHRIAGFAEVGAAQAIEAEGTGKQRSGWRNVQGEQ